jgi:C4-dicarboxylate-specific signal transduction histidine kinase
VKAIDGSAIGPRAGSCGTAIHRGAAVVTGDIETDPLWHDYRHIAAEHGLRACWSTPIISQPGRILGSFAMYYHEPRLPTAYDVETIDFATRLAAIAIDHHQAELKAAEQRIELAHLSRVGMLGELSGTLAHELRQPLTAILSDAQAGQMLLERTPPNVEAVHEILTDIVASDRMAVAVVERLRAFMVKREPERERLDLNAIITESFRIVRGELAAREIFLDLRLDAARPTVFGDRIQLQQVLLNLCMNASDAMSTCTGLGLGLSICRSIVQEHGGRLWASNNLHDRGTAFNVHLPLASAVTRAEPADAGVPSLEMPRPV